ncbi:hypothetical protein D3C76_1676300 [compost metagenome]
MCQPDFCDLAQLIRKALQPHFTLQQLYVLNLPHRRADRFVQVSRFTVDDAVHGVAHVAHNPHILELKQRLMRTD